MLQLSKYDSFTNDFCERSKSQTETCKKKQKDKRIIIRIRTC